MKFCVGVSSMHTWNTFYCPEVTIFTFQLMCTGCILWSNIVDPIQTRPVGPPDLRRTVSQNDWAYLCFVLLNLWKNDSIYSQLSDPILNEGFHFFLLHTEQLRSLFDITTVFPFTAGSFLIQSITSCNLFEQTAEAGVGSAECVSLMTIFWVDRQHAANLWLVNYQRAHQRQRQSTRLVFNCPASGLSKPVGTHVISQWKCKTYNGGTAERRVKNYKEQQRKNCWDLTML